MSAKTLHRLTVGFLMMLLAVPTATALARQATPAPTCGAVTPAVATPAADHGGHEMSGMATDTEFDQLYIDMMIPHHQSIVAMAEVALPRLTDERLREIAGAIIATQVPEIEELRGYRAAFYGSPKPAPMDGPMMEMMTQAMPGMPGTMEEMMVQMDPVAQVAAFCAAADPQLAFIDTTIAHHRMAIVASQTALDSAVHQEIASFAQRVIDAQQAEVDQLTAIREELYGTATPAPVG